MTVLLDANDADRIGEVAEHVHHDAAADWLMASTPDLTCPMTQGSLVRFLVRSGQSAAAARDVVGVRSNYEPPVAVHSLSPVSKVAGVVGLSAVDRCLPSSREAATGSWRRSTAAAHLHGVAVHSFQRPPDASSPGGAASRPKITIGPRVGAS